MGIFDFLTGGWGGGQVPGVLEEAQRAEMERRRLAEQQGIPSLSAILGGRPSDMQPYQQPAYLTPPQRSGTYDEALQSWADLTGIPDIQKGYETYRQGGGILPAIGQAGMGAVNLAGLAIPAAKALPGAIRTIGPMLGNEIGAVGDIGKIRAFHGSPHNFDQFDLSRIGTGEGAQVYGKGLYFADEPTVAESYTGPNVNWKYGRQNAQSIYDRLYNPANERGLDNEGWSKLNAQRGFWEKVLTGQSPRAIINDARINPDQFGTNELAYIQSLDPAKFNRIGGHMYEVGIPADPKTMLDWDKPFAEQHPQVQEALQQTINRAAPMTPEDLAKHFLNTGYAQQFPEASDVRIVRRILQDPSYPEELADWAAKQNSTRSSAFNLIGPVGAEPKMSTGGQIYERLGSPDEAMNTLQQAGIPGIRYLDQGSRTAGQGTSNYVIHDPDVVRRIEILRKFGLLPPAAAGGALGFSGSDQQY